MTLNVQQNYQHSYPQFVWITRRVAVATFINAPVKRALVTKVPKAPVPMERNPASCMSARHPCAAGLYGGERG